MTEIKTVEEDRERLAVLMKKWNDNCIKKCNSTKTG